MKTNLKPNARLHRPLAEQVVMIVIESFSGSLRSDRVIEKLFKSNRQLGARDRKFIAETSYEIIRWWRRLWSALGADQPKLSRGDIWRLIGAWLALKDVLRSQGTEDQEVELPNWPELNGLDVDKIRARDQEASRNRAVRESIPDWLDQLGSKELGESWDEAVHQLNLSAPVVLRANRLRTDRENLRIALDKEDIQTDFAPSTDDGLILRERKNIFSTTAFQGGMFEVQDGASQQVAPLLEPRPGDRVVDACAGAGGKTLHLAALMKNKGRIVSMDVEPRKLEECRRRCSRNGVDIVETKIIESMKTIKRLDASFDRCLLDVPCSGSGVLRRNPDAKWRLQPEEIERLKILQADILANYSAMVKPGGRLVYATCSILPSENENQVASFLASRKDQWRLDVERKFMPGADGGYDGFYAAALVRL